MEENNIDLYELKQDINSFVRYDIKEYHHKDWITTYEGIKICDFIEKLIDKIDQLEDEIKRLKGEDKND